VCQPFGLEASTSLLNARVSHVLRQGAKDVGWV
jgi:hypothetical protein